jgi:serine/threonine protein kinase
VLHAKLKRDPSREFAMKVMSKHHIMKENKIKYVMLERDILAKLSNPRIIKVALTFMDAKNLYICMEYAGGGTLHRLVEEHAAANKRLGHVDVALPASAAQFYAAEIVEALEYIHMSGVVHRDLKPENIVLTLQGHLKLCDFGSAALMEGSPLLPPPPPPLPAASPGGDAWPSAGASSTSRTSSVDMTESSVSTTVSAHDSAGSVGSSCEEGATAVAAAAAAAAGSTASPRPNHAIADAVGRNWRRGADDGTDSHHCSFVGTSEYVSPEVLRSQPATMGCDLWALGCIVFKMHTGRSPFLASSEYLTFQSILSHADGVEALAFPASLSHGPQRELIEALLQGAPRERLGAPPGLQDETATSPWSSAPTTSPSAPPDGHGSGYPALKQHGFFSGVRWGELLHAAPPFVPTDDGAADDSTAEDAGDPLIDEEFASNYLANGLGDVVASGAEREYRLSKRQQKRQQLRRDTLHLADESDDTHRTAAVSAAAAGGGSGKT